VDVVAGGGFVVVLAGVAVSFPLLHAVAISNATTSERSTMPSVHQDTPDRSDGFTGSRAT
jgi:hypothetical protein